jgi:membrane-associated phospholipid phosphatase
MINPDFPNLWSRLNVAILLLSLSCGLVIEVGDLNQSVFLQINGLGAEVNDLVWASLTILGDTRIILASLLLFFLGHIQIAWAYLLILIPGGILIQGMKRLFSAERPMGVLDPSMVHLIGEPLKHHSFPSGHTASLFALAAIVIASKLPTSLRILVLIIVTAASISRITVGAHWPSDVAAGAFLGSCIGIASVLLYRRFIRYTTSNKSHRLLWLTLVMIAGSIFFDQDTDYPSVEWLGFFYVGLCLIIGLYLFLLGESSRFRSDTQ